MEPVEMFEADVLMALAALRWIKSPRDSTKARDLADLKRQGIDLKAAVEWFRFNPRADWYVGLRELKKGIGYLTPVGTRGEATPTKPVEAIKKEAEKAFEEERKPENVKRREELASRLKALGIPIKEVKG